jgi:hypothetical protein
MANHRASGPDRSWWHTVGARLRPSPTAPVPEPRLPSIELVDARTRVAHQVSPDVLLAGRARGEYEALCGAQLLAASLTDPGRGRCESCREQATPPARGGRAALSWRGGAR